MPRASWFAAIVRRHSSNCSADRRQTAPSRDCCRSEPNPGSRRPTLRGPQLSIHFATRAIPNQEIFTASSIYRHIAGVTSMNACPDRNPGTPCCPAASAAHSMRCAECPGANGASWSLRGLQACPAARCSGSSGYSSARAPHAALRDIRFETARRELLQGMPDGKVMDVAQRCGFPHFGRFSVEYRRRFGETPSQTLKRQAAFSDALASMPPFFIPAVASGLRRARPDRHQPGTQRQCHALPTNLRPP